MRTLRILMLAALAMLASVAAYANHYADFYVIPVAGHNAGLNGTMWMSDIAIQNFQSTPLTVELVLIESGSSSDNVFPLTTATVNGSVTVPANGSLLLSDALNGHRGMSNIYGAILIGANRPFAVTSRTYNTGTGGTTVPPVRDFIENTIGRTDLSMAVAYIPGLIANSRFRTNLGMVVGNASQTGEAMGVSVTLRDAGGATLGTSNFAIAGGNFTHMQFSSRSVADRTFDIGSAEFRITSGNGAVVPYAAITDNASGDAFYVTGQFPPSTAANAAATSSAYPSAFRDLFDRVKIRREVQ